MFIWTEFTELKIWLAGKVCVFVKIFHVPTRILRQVCKRDVIRICFYNIRFLYIYICEYKSICCILIVAISNSKCVPSSDWLILNYKLQSLWKWPQPDLRFCLGIYLEGLWKAMNLEQLMSRPSF